MKGILYTLTNKINGSKYVGKTYSTVKARWLEHIRDSSRFPNRPLYKAINTFGSENFLLETVGEYEESILETEEQKLIAILDSYKNGYNATIGGDGRPRCKVSDASVFETFSETKEVMKTAAKLKIDHKRVSKLLTEAGISTKTAERSVIVDQLNMKFQSVTKCADYFLEQGLTTNKYVKNKIYDVLRGTRKSYLNYTFTYGD